MCHLATLIHPPWSPGGRQEVSSKAFARQLAAAFDVFEFSVHVVDQEGLDVDHISRCPSPVAGLNGTAYTAAVEALIETLKKKIQHKKNATLKKQ